MSTIAEQRSYLGLPNPWPCDNEITALTEKSSGLFIFASTLVRFIESESYEPNEGLQLILSEASGTTYEGRTGIDLLYLQVLQHAFPDTLDSGVFDDLKCILGAIVLAFNPLSQKELFGILGISEARISTTLHRLRSVILVPDDQHEEIRIFHKSFPDLLHNNIRCIDPRFYIDPATYHKVMVLGCLKLVNGLKRNPCSLPPFIMNQNIRDLPQLLGQRLGGAVQYACCYWARHLDLSPKSGDHIDNVANSVTKILENSPLWIEVMSLENHLEGVIHSMHDLLDWRDKVSDSLLLPNIEGLAY